MDNVLVNRLNEFLQSLHHLSFSSRKSNSWHHHLLIPVDRTRPSGSESPDQALADRHSLALRSVVGVARTRVVVGRAIGVAVIIRAITVPHIIGIALFTPKDETRLNLPVGVMVGVVVGST